MQLRFAIENDQSALHLDSDAFTIVPVPIRRAQADAVTEVRKAAAG